jgi:hypothetical protein
MKMTNTAIKRRVAKGVRFLNKEYGRSWLRKIDPEALALEESTACLLGQLEGNYCVGRDDLGLSEDEARSLGFNLDAGHTDSFDTLTRTWKDSIVRLRRLFHVE